MVRTVHTNHFYEISLQISDPKIKFSTKTHFLKNDLPRTRFYSICWRLRKRWLRSGECGSHRGDCGCSKTVEQLIFPCMYAEIASQASHVEAHIKRFLLVFLVIRTCGKCQRTLIYNMRHLLNFYSNLRCLPIPTDRQLSSRPLENITQRSNFQHIYPKGDCGTHAGDCGRWVRSVIALLN